MADLAQCPFCAADGCRVVPVEMRTRVVACPDCGASGPAARTSGQAEGLWNRRAAPSPAVERVIRAAQVVADRDGTLITTAEEVFEWSQNMTAAFDELNDSLAALRAEREGGGGG